MQPATQHVMHLERTHPSGQEEWSCPTCGRRFLLQWPPSFKKIILNPGDDAVAHSGAKGSPELQLVMATDQVSVQPSIALNGSIAEPIDTDDSLPAETLTPWLKWLQHVEFLDPLPDEI
jgi:hypothetical protein